MSWICAYNTVYFFKLHSGRVSEAGRKNLGVLAKDPFTLSLSDVNGRVPLVLPYRFIEGAD